MEFRTKVNIESFGQKIDHLQIGLSLGSCFAGNIAARMRRAKFPIEDNPFGVLFNPVSIADSVRILHERRRFGTADLEERAGLWSSFAFHGSFSSPDAEQALERMNRAVEQGADALRDAQYVIVTFGTAWVYELARTGHVVANCHKFPASRFVRRRLTSAEIVGRFDALFEGPLKGKRVIFTVSPVRHVKDGFPENTLSKAVLVEAVHELVGRHPQAGYFPAFEIMNDELRDYRFYAEDMVHPSPVAVQYIWERFSQAAFSEKTRAAAVGFEKLAAAMGHRPLNPGTESHTEFLRSMAGRVDELAGRFPSVDLSVEREYFGGRG